MNQNDKEGQSSGRTTGASGNQAENQQKRTIEGQESQPGKVWQESDQGQYGKSGSGQGGSTGQGQSSGQGGSTGQGQYTGQGDTSGGGSSSGGTGGSYAGGGVGGGTGGESSGGNPQGQYSGMGGTSGGSGQTTTDDGGDQSENEQLDESQWQGNRFSQGGGIGNQGGSIG